MTAPGTAAEPQALPRGKVRAIFGGLLLAMLLAALDQTIVAAALPTIVSDLGGAEHLSWVVTAYLLASTATTVLWGKLGDLFGRKTLFIACILIFLVGSILSGTSQTMGQLVAWRAVQGVGGGGLMVLSQAIIGDVVPPRERGRYQGLFGALALIVVASVLPRIAAGIKPRIDYAGIILLATISTAIVLVTSLGGTTWAWSSAPEYGMVALAAAALVAFVVVERRPPEPVLPLHLFRSKVFSVAAVIGFAVGFAMFGAITYLPLYLQTVKGSTPTESGLEMTSMTLGLLITSIGSGQLISRTGRYKIYPILGTAITAVGLYLLSLMDQDTTTLQAGLSMFVLGAGLGMVTQVLVIAVQNAVSYRDLGTATSGTTYFRTIGSSVGVAVFGTIFAHRLTDELATAVPGTAQGPCGPEALAASTQALAQCPPEVREWFLDAYAGALHVVFLWAVPVAVLAFLLTWLLPEVELRTATRGGDGATAGHAAGESFALPSSRTPAGSWSWTATRSGRCPPPTSPPSRSGRRSGSGCGATSPSGPTATSRRSGSSWTSSPSTCWPTTSTAPRGRDGLRHDRDGRRAQPGRSRCDSSATRSVHRPDRAGRVCGPWSSYEAVGQADGQGRRWSRPCWPVWWRAPQPRRDQRARRQRRA